MIVVAVFVTCRIEIVVTCADSLDWYAMNELHVEKPEYIIVVDTIMNLESDCALHIEGIEFLATVSDGYDKL